MPTLNILPDSDISNSPAWDIAVGAGTTDVYAVLDDDDSGHVTSDSSDIEGNSTGRICEVGFENHGLAAGTTINSVTAVVKHNNRGRGVNYTIQVTLKSSSVNYYTEDISDGGSASWTATTLTQRTTSDGTNPWTLSELDGLQMKLELTAISGGITGITYVYFIIDYGATGYGNNVAGVDDVAKVNGTAVASIEKVIGV